jgi:hypothetical protein
MNKQQTDFVIYLKKVFFKGTAILVSCVILITVVISVLKRILYIIGSFLEEVVLFLLNSVWIILTYFKGIPQSIIILSWLFYITNVNIAKRNSSKQINRFYRNKVVSYLMELGIFILCVGCSLSTIILSYIGTLLNSTVDTNGNWLLVGLTINFLSWVTIAGINGWME